MAPTTDTAGFYPTRRAKPACRTHPMTSRLSRSFALAALAAGLFACTGGLTLRRSHAEDKKAEPAPQFTKEQVSFYEKDVLPLLQKHCLRCHGNDPEKIKGGLDLT